MKKTWKRWIAGCVAAVLLVCAGCGTTGGAVAVQSVTSLGQAGMGSRPRFAGIVATGQVLEVRREGETAVKSFAVAVGDEVKEGDELFTYDDEALRFQTEEKRLEVEVKKESIANLQRQIKELENERAKAPAGDRLSYTLEIQERENDMREANYALKEMERELTALEERGGEVRVFSSLSGRVTAVNDTGATGDDGQELPLVVVTETGKLQVKGYFNELNRAGISEGAAVTILPRDNGDSRWTGSISRIDWEGGSTSRGDYFDYYDSDETATSSRYPFWAELNDSEGLIIGQHVYIELGEAPADDGEIRLPEGFVLDMNTVPWVWAEGAHGKLEKRKIVLGGSDGAAGEVIVSQGLEATDWIAWPEEGLKVGQRTVHTEGSVAVVTKEQEEANDASVAG